MKRLSLIKKLINFGYGIKYSIKNRTPERQKALAKLNKRRLDECIDGITDVVAITLSGLYVTVKPCKAGINIKYQGNLLVNKELVVYWDKDGLGLSSNITKGSLDIGEFSIAEIVDFTPVNTDKESKPKVFPMGDHYITMPETATAHVDVNVGDLVYSNTIVKAHEMSEQHIIQIRKLIQLLDTVLTKPSNSQ